MFILFTCSTSPPGLRKFSLVLSASVQVDRNDHINLSSDNNLVIFNAVLGNAECMMQMSRKCIAGLKTSRSNGRNAFSFFKSLPDRRCRRHICRWMQSTDTATPFSQAQIGKCFVWCPFPWIDQTCIKQTLLRCYCIFTYRNRRWLVLWDTKTWPVLEYLLVCVSRATGFTLIFNAANEATERALWHPEEPLWAHPAVHIELIGNGHPTGALTHICFTYYLLTRILFFSIFSLSRFYLCFFESVLICCVWSLSFCVPLTKNGAFPVTLQLSLTYWSLEVLKSVPWIFCMR